MSHNEVQLCLGKWFTDVIAMPDQINMDFILAKYHDKYLKDLKKAIRGIMWCLSAKYARKAFKTLKKHLNGVYIDNKAIKELEYLDLDNELWSAVRMAVHQLNVKYSRKCFKSLNKHILKIDAIKDDNIYHMRFAHLKYDAYAVLTDIKTKKRFMDYRNYEYGTSVRDIYTDEYHYFIFLKEHDPEVGFYDDRIVEVSVSLPCALNNGTFATRTFKNDDNELPHQQLVDFIIYQLQEQLSDLIHY